MERTPIIWRAAGWVAAGAILGLTLTLAPLGRAAPGLARFASVRGDIRPLLALGGGAQAEALRASLAAIAEQYALWLVRMLPAG